MKILNTNLLIIVLIISSLNFKLGAQNKDADINNLMEKYYELGMFNGSVLVADKGEVIYKKPFGYANFEWNVPNTVDTKYELGSVTKQFTAAVILQLVEEGKLKLDDKISDILSYYPEENGSKITIHHLLTHTSGIPNYTDFPEFIKQIAMENLTPRQLFGTFADKPLNFEPGSQFSYSNSGYIVLGAVIEQVTGKSYEEELNERIFNPLAMTNSGYIHLERITSDRAYGYDNQFNHYTNAHYLDMSVPYSAGALYSTVEDLYKWDQALYGDKILSEKSKQKMFTGYIQDFRGKYGYGWDVGYQAVNKKGDSVSYIMHGGSIFGFNSLIVRIPDHKQLIVLLNNTSRSPLYEIYNGIRNVLYDQPVKEPLKPLVDQVAEIIDIKGVDAGINYYQNGRSMDSTQKISEQDINQLGYYFMRDNKTDDAVKIFKLNIEEYPESFNVYDSYAEALMAEGKIDSAITNYKKSLEFNPRNMNAYNQLEKMGVKLERPAERKAIFVDQAIYENLSGEYQLQPGFTITVSTSEGKIFAQATGQPRFEIYPESETKYFLKVIDARITFVKDEEGKFSKLILHQNGRDMPARKIM